MKLHERTMLVQKHHCDLDKVMIDFMDGRDITYVELLIILSQVTQSMILKYMLRHERHPDDPEKRGGEE